MFKNMKALPSILGITFLSSLHPALADNADAKEIGPQCELAKPSPFREQFFEGIFSHDFDMLTNLLVDHLEVYKISGKIVRLGLAEAFTKEFVTCELVATAGTVTDFSVHRLCEDEGKETCIHLLFHTASQDQDEVLIMVKTHERLDNVLTLSGAEPDKLIFR